MMRKICLSAVMVFLLISNPLYAETAQDYQNQIDNITKQLQSNQSQQTTWAGEIAAVDAQVQVIQLQISQTSVQIDDLNNKINDLNVQIAKAEDDLTKQKALLGEYMKQMYIDGQTSQIELILTSNNFSDFVDKSQYLDTMQSNVNDTVSSINTLKSELEKSKHDVEVSLSTQVSLQQGQIAQRNAISAQEAYKATLLANSKADSTQLANQKNDIYLKMISLEDSHGDTAYAGYTNYPWGNPPSNPDTDDGIGYFEGECTSYVAWKRSTIGKPIPKAIGNGGEWGTAGHDAGYPTDSSNPQKGDVIVFPSWSVGGVGHVAYIEGVNSDGTVLISQYNWPVWFPNEVPFSEYYPSKGMWYGKFRYSTMTINPYEYGAWFIHQ
jgi:peptidoglycan hydrolase CwlO-like protein